MDEVTSHFAGCSVQVNARIMTILSCAGHASCHLILLGCAVNFVR